MNNWDKERLDKSIQTIDLLLDIIDKDGPQDSGDDRVIARARKWLKIEQDRTSSRASSVASHTGGRPDASS